MRISDWSSDVCSSDLKLLGIVVNVEDIGVAAVNAVAHHPDAADEHAILVERQSSRIGGEAERRAFGADQRRGARRAETRHKVAARQLAELHPEQGSAFEPDGGRRGREMLLDDLARGARRKGVAAARSEEHTSELQSLMRISYAVFCLKKKKRKNQNKIRQY